MDETELAQRFEQSLSLHEVMDYPEPGESLDDVARNWSEGVLAAAQWTLAAQSIKHLHNDLRFFLHQGDDFVKALFADDRNLGLLLALFIAGRELGDAVTLVNDSVAIGDHPNGLSTIRVEVGARRGDFRIEFLIAWTEFGPHPAWEGPGDTQNPSSLEVTRELALVREHRVEGASDRKTRRLGLASLGMTVVSYDDGEEERDPVGVATRALREVQRAADDEFIA
jgi:hypothetical protein